MTVGVRHLQQQELEAGLPAIRQAPKSDGVLEPITASTSLGRWQVEVVS
jgi:hypothetical protein